MENSVKNSKNARMAAFEALCKIEEENAYVNAQVKETLAKYTFSPQDKRLVSNLIYGCVRYKMRLDYIISQFSSVKLRKISVKVLVILRMGIYQMIYLSKIPKSAAVNESVKICAKTAYKSKAFVNALLRRAANEAENVKYPKDDYLSVYYSYPKELTDFFESEFGENAENILKELNCEKPITIRVNLQKTTTDKLCLLLSERNIKYEKTPHENALFISGTDIANSDLYNDGLFTVQGLSSMIAVEALEIKENMCVMDVCAAPGGKSTYIAEKTGENGCVYSFDIHEHKIDIIKKNAERMGYKNIICALNDASALNENLVNKADAVLADVPCMGLGIISKKPDIKYAYSQTAQNEISSLQFEILKNCASYVKAGGTLVYSTCSMGKKENLENIEKFLKMHDDFELKDITNCLPDSLKKDCRGAYINIMPHGGYDGFFVCAMRKKQIGEN